MDYTNIKQQGEDIILTGIKHFIPSQVLDCGQCFRWNEENSINHYKGIAQNRTLEISLEKEELILKNVSLNEFDTIWRDYFDLNRDYGELRQLYATDEILCKAIAFSPGLRIMRQNVWEILITFILSQNSNIPRIKGMVARLCEGFGQKLQCGYAFPTPEALAVLSGEDLADIRSGYRAQYIIDAAQRVADGRLNLADLKNMPTDYIRQALMEVHGVGPKVADCVLLYGFGRVECYPMDVWMKRVMAKYYPDGFPKELLDTAGIAQQFLFHYERTA
ncbi:MAG: DNA-3-methyladenine glycosylase 2 family protein, partial [Defluviitaleaceae bacterium]|nr:DNA-3-methyladenine glycosylase 2 family protein [Defluviitaleaceae bacterium]